MQRAWGPWTSRRSPAERPVSLTLEHRPGTLAICRLAPDAPVPAWASSGTFHSVTRTADELSIVCDASVVPADVPAERDTTALRVVGTLDLSMVGVLSALSAPLAAAKVPIFVISTFDTDWLLVRTTNYPRAVRALTDAGFPVLEPVPAST